MIVGWVFLYSYLKLLFPSVHQSNQKLAIHRVLHVANPKIVHNMQVSYLCYFNINVRCIHINHFTSTSSQKLYQQVKGQRKLITIYQNQLQQNLIALLWHLMLLEPTIYPWCTQSVGIVFTWEKQIENTPWWNTWSESLIETSTSLLTFDSGCYFYETWNLNLNREKITLSIIHE